MVSSGAQRTGGFARARLLRLERYPEELRRGAHHFPDTETSNWTWDPVAQAYYWHRFFAHQPDLNFDNPHVLEAVLSIVDFWLDLGVDGLHLDAVPYLIERDGTSCENLPDSHAFLREMRQDVDDGFPERVLLAETNQWPERRRPYFGDGDECHMAFHFPVMPRLFMALRMEDRLPIIDILNRRPISRRRASGGCFCAITTSLRWRW